MALEDLHSLAIHWSFKFLVQIDWLVALSNVEGHILAIEALLCLVEESCWLEWGWVRLGGKSIVPGRFATHMECNWLQGIVWLNLPVSDGSTVSCSSWVLSWPNRVNYCSIISNRNARSVSKLVALCLGQRHELSLWLEMPEAYLRDTKIALWWGHILLLWGKNTLVGLVAMSMLAVNIEH